MSSYEECYWSEQAKAAIKRAEDARENGDEKAQLDACNAADFALTNLERTKREEAQQENAA